MACQNALQTTISARSIDKHYPKSIYLEPFAGSSFFFFFFHDCLHQATFSVELMNHTMMHQSINGDGRDHRVFKDLLPPGVRQIASDHHAAPSLAVCRQDKRRLRF